MNVPQQGNNNNLGPRRRRRQRVAQNGFVVPVQPRQSIQNQILSSTLNQVIILIILMAISWLICKKLLL